MNAKCLPFCVCLFAKRCRCFILAPTLMVNYCSGTLEFDWKSLLAACFPKGFAGEEERKKKSETKRKNKKPSRPLSLACKLWGFMQNAWAMRLRFGELHKKTIHG